MGLGIEKKEKKVFLNLNNGKVERTSNGRKEQFSYIEGNLLKIYDYERTFNGQKSKYWYIDMIDEEGVVYAIGFGYESGLFKTIVLSLASDDTITKDSVIRLEPYIKGGYTKAVVWNEGVKLDWVVREMPPLKEIKIGNRIIKDNTERMNFICKCVDDINGRIKYSNKVNK